MSFIELPHSSVQLNDVTVPGWAVGGSENLVRTNLAYEGERITVSGRMPVEMGGAMVLPAFIDMHTHLDKGHIWHRAPNSQGSFADALETVARDRIANWSASDVRARMEFSLRCAYAYGTRAIRTHIDSIPPQDEITWPVFAEVREDWCQKIDLQGSCLVGIDSIDFDGPFQRTATLVAKYDGLLGLVAYPVADLRGRLRKFFSIADDHGLAVDFHADETLDRNTECLRAIAEVSLESGFDHSITVGHCCSLTTQDISRALDTLDIVAQAGIHVVSLPMCNLYLQDRRSGQTPRMRGITLIHEMQSRGINVSFASDNTRDPFFAYGDLDMMEVMREATRLGHLDHSDVDWSHAFLTNPAQACGFSIPSLSSGFPADFIIFKARNWNELLSRPQSDRVVIRAGKQITRALPDYCELDYLMENA